MIVGVGVMVGVRVTVGVDVDVAVFVGVAVGVLVGVEVGSWVLVGVGVDGAKMGTQLAANMPTTRKTNLLTYFTFLTCVTSPLFSRSP